MISGTGVAGVKSALTAMKSAETKRARRRARCGSRSCGRPSCARNFDEKAPTAATKVTSPDWNGFRPKPSCSISGSRNGMAPMPMRKFEPPMMPARKSG